MRQAQEILAPTGIELIGALGVHGRATEEEENAARSLAEELANRIKGKDDQGKAGV